MQGSGSSHAVEVGEAVPLEGQAPQPDPRPTEAAEALAAGDYSRVLALTGHRPEAPGSGWLDYDRASALTALGRTDEAVRFFRQAEAEFATTRDEAQTSSLWRSRRAGLDEGQAVSIWGRARALSLAGRCAEAAGAFKEYEDLVRDRDPLAARMAPPYSSACRAPLVLR